MPQSDGKNTLKRMTIYDPNNKTTYNFTLNPQEYVETRPQRVTVVKTMSDIVIEDFNSDVPTLRISGHTGWNRGEGQKKFDQLRAILHKYANGTTNYGKLSGEPLYFYNYTDNQHYRVHLTPEGYTFKRSSEKPLLFDYEINFYIVSNTATYKNPKDSVISKKEVTTGDKNATKKTTTKKKTTKKKKTTTKKKPTTQYKGSLQNIPRDTTGGSNAGSEVQSTSTTRPLDAMQGYADGSFLGSTGVGSTRLGNNLGVVR